MREVSEDTSQMIEETLRKFLHMARAILSMSDGVVQRLVHISVKL